MLRVLERRLAQTWLAQNLEPFWSAGKNPRADNFFAIVAALQEMIGVRLRVVARAG